MSVHAYERATTAVLPSIQSGDEMMPNQSCLAKAKLSHSTPNSNDIATQDCQACHHDNAQDRPFWKDETQPACTVAFELYLHTIMQMVHIQLKA